MTDSQPQVEAFITRWAKASGSERANYQLFLTGLAQLLSLPEPEPANEDTRDNAYVFERRVDQMAADGTLTPGYIDLYRRGCFVCEAKKVRAGEHTKGFGATILGARNQAEGYARAIPSNEGRPPFLMVVDVGNFIELYAEFTRTGGNYVPFPDPRSYRIRLADLRSEDVRQRLRQVWLEPLSLDPTKQSARVTREIAARLANVAKALEGAGHHAEQVAGFLTRCLFTFFAEDVGLLPKRAFADLLDRVANKPEQFVPTITELWRAMDTGQFSVAITSQVLHFNGKLFKNPEVLPLDRDQIGLLIEAAKADWKQVEPAIFGTLVERALNPETRHALGAHYTPRAYVERLVFPTVIDPLREEWKNVQVAALALASEGNLKEAEKTLRQFHHRLCSLRVLDPACGSGNFLYVTMEHLKRLEGEVLNQLADLGVTLSLETEGLTVDPHQFLGIEINPRAAAVAEMVLWIGYLQWHFRTRGEAAPPQPVLRDFRNIECRDAVLAYDKVEYVLDQHGKPVTRWDGKTYKKHPVTGDDVPNEAAVVPLERYVNPRKAEWPAADYVVGNPPFIGNKKMREDLGDGYVQTLRATWDDVPESVDLVMYWWSQGAKLIQGGKLNRLGLITTNSITQTFNRQVVQQAINGGASITFAIPDHPWVDNTDGADVRIAMTVAKLGNAEGRLNNVIDEVPSENGEVAVLLEERKGLIHSDLRIGANVAAARQLRANSSLGNRGMIPHGEGFLVTDDLRDKLDGGALLRPYRNWKDITGTSRGKFVIDTYGISEVELRNRYPGTWQWLFERVKPERDHNSRKSRRENWWLFAENQPRCRKCIKGIRRYIATGQTAKHRLFLFLESSTLPDDKIISIGLDDAYFLGILSSSIHTIWSLAAGGWMGVGNDPVYNKTKCFDAFPFPDANDVISSCIRAIAEQLDAHRKRQQDAFPSLTLTGIYNALEKLRSHESLTAQERDIHEKGLVSVLKQLHDELDLAVLDAYGWSDLAPLMQVANGNAPAGSHGTPATRDDCTQKLNEVLLDRLVALNVERAEEERRGLIRWLRPELQNPAAGARADAPIAAQDELEVDVEEAPAIPHERTPWPKELPDQVKAVADLLAASRAPLDEEAIAAQFTGKGPWKKRLPTILNMLVAVGRARLEAHGYTSLWRSAPS